MTEELRIDRDLDRDLVAVYRGWHRLEAAQQGPEIVDFDLAGEQAPRRFTDRSEVRRELVALVKRLGDGEAHALVRARLGASIAYLEALEGAVVPIGQYVARTLGIEAASIPEGEIAAQRAVLEGELAVLATPLSFSAADSEAFQASLAIRDRDRLPAEFARFRGKWVPRLLAEIPAPLDDYEIEVRTASEDAYWKNWISGALSERRMLLRINVHPRHTWYRGAVENLVLHEYCGHAVQMVAWHRRIERGEMPGFFGILTVHFPDQFALEGLAGALAHFVPDEEHRLEPEARVLRELQRYSLLVMNNLHLLANREGSERALAYGRERLPFTTEETLEKEIRDRTRNPLFRTYQYVYGISQRAFLAALSGLERRRGWALLRTVYERPLTRPQFERAARRMARAQVR